MCKNGFFSRFLTTVLTVLLTVSASAAQKYQANWASLDSRPAPQWFLDAKFGIFIHWGVYSVPAWGPEKAYSEWYWRYAFNDDGTLQGNEWGRFHEANYGASFPYTAFAPMFKCEMFDPDEWADIFARAGAKYVVLTSKHHDGFCLWPSKEANKTWGMLWNSVDAGPGRDLLGDLGHAVRKAGLKMGFYYSLYEWFNPLWRMDKPRYVAEHMAPQFMDVVMRYKPSIIFSDGEWDLPDQQWKSPELLAWLFNESPCKDEVVINDRWGKDIRHKHGGYYTTEYGAGLKESTHPWEENRGIGYSFGYNRNEPLSNYRSTEELVFMLVDLVSRGGNLLLDVGPTADGRIPMIMQSRLVEMGDWLAVNGEAIYGTRPWSRSCEWSAGTMPAQDFGQHKTKYNVMDLVRKSEGDRAYIQVFFTSKSETLYAITPGWPGAELVLRNVRPKDNSTISMLGFKSTLPWRMKGNDLAIDVSTITADKLPCQWAYSFRINVRPPAEEPQPAPKEPEKEPEDDIERIILDSLKDIFK